jgi:hypothetical protein
MSIIGRWMAVADGRRMAADAKHYGGVSEDSDERGKAAYKALLAGGSSGFSALLGGGRSDEGPVCTIGSPRILVDGIRE